MAGTMRTDVFAVPTSGLNSFLFADIGAERSGMTLSVLSALARLGVDPWQEAARLANLPRLAAVEALAQAIASLPASLWPPAEATTIATRLVRLLPDAAGSLPMPLPRRWQRLLVFSLGVAVFAMVLFGLALSHAGRNAAATRADGVVAHAPAAPE